MRTAASSEAELAERLTELVSAHRSLRACTDVGELLARAAGVACGECGFHRGLVLTVKGSALSAAETAPLADEDSERLRREALAAPLPLRHGTEETVVVRRATTSRIGDDRLPSTLAEALGLEHFVLAPVAPESAVLALLLLDRDTTEAGPMDVALAGACAGMIAVTLEQLVLRTRVDQLSQEVREFAASAQALSREVRDAPIALHNDLSDALGPSLFRSAPARGAGARTADGRAAGPLLSEREEHITALLVHGRSNREIADELVLSPETVKSHVARILRKLNASNRAEAVARYLQLTGG